MFEMRRTGPREHRGELRPCIGGAHVDDADCLDAWLWRLDPEQPRWLAALDTPPELALSGYDEVLVQRIGIGRDLHPLAAAGDHREHRLPCRHHPHVVLQLRHVLLGGSFLRERPRQHELGFEDRPAGLNPPVQRRRHPLHRRMSDPALDVGDHLPGIELVPTPIEVLGDCPKLNNQVPREVLRLDLPSLLPPQPHQGDFVIAHDDPGVRAADKRAAIRSLPRLH